MTISAKLFSVTKPVDESLIPDAEGLIAHAARVSSPREYSERYKDAEGLLRYCVRNKHWSIFEMADATVEIEAPRDISRQLLRHRSFSFQEFSQRYSSEISFCDRSFRGQDLSNRQNSVDDLDRTYKHALSMVIGSHKKRTQDLYSGMLDNSVAKECARVILPEGLTMSFLYMKGSIRSWLHYLEVREGNGTQLEHIQLANSIREAITPAFPTILGMSTKEEVKKPWYKKWRK